MPALALPATAQKFHVEDAVGTGIEARSRCAESRRRT
jgi:hypothetical protein